jgi:hypothetical protein
MLIIDWSCHSFFLYTDDIKKKIKKNIMMIVPGHVVTKPVTIATNYYLIWFYLSIT